MIATLADFDETHHAFRNTCRSRIEASWPFGPILLRGPAPPRSRFSISIFRFSPRRLSLSGHVDMILLAGTSLGIGPMRAWTRSHHSASSRNERWARPAILKTRPGGWA